MSRSWRYVTPLRIMLEHCALGTMWKMLIMDDNRLLWRYNIVARRTSSEYATTYELLHDLLLQHKLTQHYSDQNWCVWLSVGVCVCVYLFSWLFDCSVTQVAIALALVVVGYMPHRVAPLYDVDQSDSEGAPLALCCYALYAPAHECNSACVSYFFSYWVPNCETLIIPLRSCEATASVIQLSLLLLLLVWGSNLILDM